MRTSALRARAAATSLGPLLRVLQLRPLGGISNMLPRISRTPLCSSLIQVCRTRSHSQRCTPRVSKASVNYTQTAELIKRARCERLRHPEDRAEGAADRERGFPLRIKNEEFQDPEREADEYHAHLENVQELDPLANSAPPEVPAFRKDAERDVLRYSSSSLGCLQAVPAVRARFRGHVRSVRVGGTPCRNPGIVT